MSAMTDQSDQADQAPPPSSAWRPPKQGGVSVASIIVGLVFIGIGIWYFLDQTLGVQMPRVSWGDLWPIFLIIIGGVILYRSAVSRS
jgi:LiaF transmembrane domain